MDNSSQGGYGVNNVARNAAHDVLKFEGYYGWKECQRLGIPYERGRIEHCNLYIRTARFSHNEGVSFTYRLDKGLIAVHEQGVKYTYPAGLTDEQKRKFRAAARKAKKSQ